MDGGHNMPALQLAVQLCRLYLVDDKHRNIVSEGEFSNTLETLTRVYQSRQNSEGLVLIVCCLYHFPIYDFRYDFQ